MDYVILALATLCASGKALFCKAVGSAKGREIFLANFKSFAVATLVALCFAAPDLGTIASLSPFTLGLSAIFAASVFFTQLMQMKAMSEGPASLTTLIYSSAFLIPIVFGAIVWSEPISPVQYIGIGTLIVSMALIILNKSEEKINLKWLLFVFLAALGSGLNAIIQKLHQFSEHSDELTLFLLFALAFSAVISIIGYLVYRPKGEIKEIKIKKEEKKSLREIMYKLSPIPLGICVGLLNFLNLMLAGRLPSAVQFPVYNVGSLILTGVVSVLLFKERLGIRRLVGCLIGIVAIVLIGMF
ncbi:MAG: EamA family transporter [Clostridia bacterium]|nr:EamA family transporter [Clostridia bacterium]